MRFRATTAVQRAVLSGLLILSGFCGISYEVLYARLLGNLVGDQFAVAVAVLLAFLLGIGLGTYCAHLLWKHLWLLEACIGAYGICLALNVSRVDMFLYHSRVLASSSLSASVLVCVVLVALPAFLIGCTLPLFAGYLSRVMPEPAFARAYWLYNFGACATALLIEFWLLRSIGLCAAILAIASLNAVTSAALLVMARGIRRQRPESAKWVRFPKHHLAALALASVASAIFQLTMFRVTECLLGPFHETFALVLAMVLFGQAVGSVLVEKFNLTFGQLLLLNLIGLAALIGWFVPAAELYAVIYPWAAGSYVSSVVAKVGLLFILMGLPSTTFGSTIPALLNLKCNVARHSGQLLCLSSVANAAGFLLMAFVLHPLLDYGVMVLAIAGLSTLSLVVYLGRPNLRTVGVFAGLLGFLYVYAVRWDENVLYVGHTAFHSLEDLNKARSELVYQDRFKGHRDVFAINWRRGRPYFFINGYVSIPLNSPSEKLVGAISALVAPRTDRALVLGVGSGATASSVALLFDHTDAVEINPVVLQNLHRMAPYNFGLHNMDKVNLIHDDAVHFVKGTTNKYSLIINTVTTPLYFSSSKLYTQDFLEAARQRLSPDGVYVTWVDSRIGERGIDIILKTLSGCFDHCAIASVKSAYFLLLCSREPIRVHNPHLIAANAVLSRHLMVEYGLFSEWVPYCLLSLDAFKLISDRAVAVNTVDYPSLEFEMSRLRKRGIDQFRRRLIDNLSIETVAEAFPLGRSFSPVRLVLWSEQRLGDCDITRRWRGLLLQSCPGYRESCREETLLFWAARAEMTDTAKAHHGYGVQLAKHGEYSRARVEFRRALQLEPWQQGSSLEMGKCCERLGLLQEALGWYERVQAMARDDDEVCLHLGRICVKLGRMERGLYLLDEYLYNNVHSAEGHFYRGRALESLGMLAEADRAYRDALRYNPDNNEALEAIIRIASGSSGSEKGLAAGPIGVGHGSTVP